MRQQLLLTAAPGRSQRQEVAIKHIYSQRGPFLLPSSARLIYIQHNESGERRATQGEKEMMGLRERGVKKKKKKNEKRVKVTNGQTNYPALAGTFIFPRGTHKHATTSSQSDKDR